MSSISLEMFQSLSGFQVRCNSKKETSPLLTKTCFNPYRVFRFAATSPGQAGRWSSLLCFNPYRVFRFAATISFTFGTKLYTRFQSLSGFQVRCNIILRLWSYQSRTCFNPYRVFRFAATHIISVSLYPCEFSVSIPIGFSGSLQRHP